MLGAPEADVPPWPAPPRVGNAGLGVAYGVALGLLTAGLVAAVAGARRGAYLLLGGFVFQFTLDVSVGIAAFRKTMARPWPKVAPVVDDDW